MNHSNEKFLDHQKSLEIEERAFENGNINYQIEAKKDTSQVSQISVAISYVSLLLDKGISDEKGYIIEAALMVTTTLIWAILHLATKYLFTISPEMNGFDVVSVMAYSIIPFFYVYAKIRGVNCSIFSFTPKI